MLTKKQSQNLKMQSSSEYKKNISASENSIKEGNSFNSLNQHFINNPSALPSPNVKDSDQAFMPDPNNTTEIINEKMRKQGDEFSENNRQNVFNTNNFEINNNRQATSLGMKSLSPFSSVEESKDRSFQNSKNNKNGGNKGQIKIGYEDEEGHPKAAPNPLM